MIDLFALEYPNYIIKHTFNNVILLTDQKTGVSFSKDNSGLYAFKDIHNNHWFYSEVPVRTPVNGQYKFFTKGECGKIDLGNFQVMTHTKEEIIQKAIEYFLPLADKNDGNFILREGEIFLN